MSPRRVHRAGKIGTQVTRSCLVLGSGLTKLMVVGEAKPVYVALVGDGKSEIGTTEGILKPHVAPASPGLQHHTLGNKESFCRQKSVLSD